MTPKWEYLTYVFNVGYSLIKGPELDGGSFTEKLNEYGAEGWELVSLLPLEGNKGISATVHAVFKRPVSQ